MTINKNTVLALALAVFVTLGLSACGNTVHGAGEDITNAGDAVQHSVQPKN